MKISLKSVFRVTLIYFIFGISWIKFSDYLLIKYIKDIDRLSLFQTYKGITFVFISTTIIYITMLIDLKYSEKLNSEKGKSDNLLKSLIDSSDSYISVSDISGKHIMLNKKTRDFLKIEKEHQDYTAAVEKSFPSKHISKFKKLDKKVLETGKPIKTELEFPNNEVHQVSRFPIRDSDNNIFAIGTIANDISEKKEYYKKLAIESTVFKTLKQGILLVDTDMKIVQTNEAVYDIIGIERGCLIGKDIQNILFTDINLKYISESVKKTNKIYEKESFLKKSNQSVFPAWISINYMQDKNENFEYYVLIIEDLTEIKQKEKRIIELEKTDPLTGLKNQSELKKSLKKIIASSNETNIKPALVYVDINNLKLINDSMGYSAGDKIIKSVGMKLSSLANSRTNIYRMSGDEFALLTLKNKDALHLEDFSNKVLELLKPPIKISDKDIQITVNIGISSYPDDGIDAESIIQSANTALRHSKTKGAMEIEFFSKTFKDELDSDFELSTSLAKAVENKELLIYYQPQVDALTKKIKGLEALLRWKHPKYGIISPNKFIPIAESSGLIHEIGLYVLKNAGEQFKTWLDSGYNIKNLCVNLSPVQFKAKNIVLDIIAQLKSIGLEGKFLDVEITETALINDVGKAQNTLLELKRHGISVSIDDFGTGYSSLGYLKSFSFDKLKIDRKFVMDLPEKDDGTIAQMINNLGKTLKLEVVAEGVESSHQYQFMKNIGVDTIQGYYFFKPMPAEDIEKILSYNN